MKLIHGVVQMTDTRNFILTTLIIMTLCLFLVPMVNGITCESCHSSSGGVGGYSYKDPVIKMVHDPFSTPGSRFDVSLVIVPQNDYEMWSISGAISYTGDHISLVSEPDIDGEIEGSGRAVVKWTFDALTEGTSKIEVSMEYEVYFKHDSGGNKDIGTYYDEISTNMMVSDLSVSITPGSLILTDIGQTSQITIEAKEEISNIGVIVPESLRGSIKTTVTSSELSQGELSTITVTLMNLSDIEGEILITWTESSGEKEVPVVITIARLESSDSGGDIFLLIGQITGISATILLLVGYLSGGTGPLKRLGNKAFKTAEKRIKFHCKLSYLIMKLAFFHLVVLIYGPYRDVIFDWEVVLGWVAILIMIVIAVNGIFQRRFIIRFGYENWRRVHAWGTYIATGLVVVHLLTYGSHFAWFRQLIGMQ